MHPLLAKLFAVFGDDAARLGTKAGRDAFKSPGLARNVYQGFRTGNWKGFGAAAGKSVHAGWGAAAGGYALMQLPMAMYATGQAERGTKMSTFGSSALPFLGTGLATMAFGGIPGMALGMVLDPMIKSAVGKPIQALHDLGRNTSRLKTGGDYQDTQVAFTMRQAASQEMSRSLLNARQYLGHEAAYLHS